MNNNTLPNLLLTYASMDYNQKLVVLHVHVQETVWPEGIM